MKCPTCDTKLHEVIATRKRNDQNYRRRECFNGHRFSTLETIVDMKTDAPDATRKPGRKWAQKVVNRCREEYAAGGSHKEISRLHGVPLNTLAGWLSRGERAPTTTENAG